MVVTDLNFKKLDESNKLLLGHIFEDVYLIHKLSQQVTHLGSIYGDPTYGLISDSNDWCLVGGATVILWKENSAINIIQDDSLYWTCNAKQVSDSTVELLVDAWSDKASVWSFNIFTLERHKLMELDMSNYIYSDEVNW